MSEQAHHDPGADGLARAAQAAAMSLTVIDALARLQRDRAAQRGIHGAGSSSPAHVEAHDTAARAAVRLRDAMHHGAPAPAGDTSSAAVNGTAASASVPVHATDAGHRARPVGRGADVALGAAAAAPPVPLRPGPPRQTHQPAARRR